MNFPENSLGQKAWVAQCRGPCILPDTVLHAEKGVTAGRASAGGRRRSRGAKSSLIEERPPAIASSSCASKPAGWWKPIASCSGSGGACRACPASGEASALAILGEIAALPAWLDARQWVAHSGLDPQHHRSGSSIEWRPRISRAGNPRLRAALYMPALVAVQHEPHLGRFYQRLVAGAKPSCRRSPRSCANCCTAFTPGYVTMKTTTAPGCAPPNKREGSLASLGERKKLEIEERICDFAVRFASEPNGFAQDDIRQRGALEERSRISLRKLLKITNYKSLNYKLKNFSTCAISVVLR